MDLQVPIEMLPMGFTSGSSTISRWSMRLDIDPSAYDGTVSWEWEIIAKNTNTTTDYNVTLYSDGVVHATQTVPKNMGDTRIRLRTSISAPGQVYVAIPATASGAQLTVYTSRIIVTQVGATKTQIFYPMASVAEDPPGRDYIIAPTTGGSDPYQPSPEYYPIFEYDASEYGDNVVWHFVGNASVADSSKAFQLHLYNTTDAAIVVTGTTSATVSDVIIRQVTGCANWHDGDAYETYLGMLPAGGSSPGYLFCANLRATITNLTKAKVWWRLGVGFSGEVQDLSRIYFDPEKYSESCRYYLQSMAYRAGAAGLQVVYVNDIVGSDSRTAGAVSDCEVVFESGDATKLNKKTDFWPPGAARTFIIGTRNLTSGWSYLKNALLVVKFPDTSPIDNSATLEVPIEMCDARIREYTSTISYTRTKTALDTNDYDGEVKYYLELSALTGSAIAASTWELIDDAGNTIASKTLRRRGVQRVQFTPNSGLDYYRIKTPAKATNCYSCSMRIVVSQKSTSGNPITKTRICIPMINEKTGDTLTSDSSVAWVSNSTSFNATAKQTTYYIQDNSAFDKISSTTPVRFECITSIGSGTTASCICALINATDVIEEAGSHTTVSTTVPTYNKVDIAALTDGKRYQVRIKRSGGTSSNNMQIHNARISIALVDFVKTDVYWRKGYQHETAEIANGSMLYLDKRAYGGRSTFRHEALGYSSAVSATITQRVYEVSEQAVSASADLSWNNEGYSRKRSDEFELPSSGYTYISSKAEGNNTTNILAVSFIVLFPVNISGRKPDFWPMFLGDLYATTRKTVLCP